MGKRLGGLMLLGTRVALLTSRPGQDAELVADWSAVPSISPFRNYEAFKYSVLLDSIDGIHRYYEHVPLTRFLSVLYLIHGYPQPQTNASIYTPTRHQYQHQIALQNTHKRR